MKTTHKIVRWKSDWGEFFVAEREPVVENGHTRYTATWTCYSSYGTFGHHWYSMGESFAKFIQDVEQGYLLSKISTRVANEKKTFQSIKRAILENRREKRITKEVARDAMEAVRGIENEGHGAEASAVLIYHDHDIGKAEIEWSDLSTMEHPTQSILFAERIWPEFVKEMAAEICEPATTTMANYTDPVNFTKTNQYGCGPNDEDDVYTVEEFRERCQNKSFVDYDGYGHPVRDKLADESIYIYPSRTEEIPKDATHIVWFNR